MGAISARASGLKTVATAAGLPASGFEGQQYEAADTGVTYLWHSGAWVISGGATGVTGPASATDNAIARYDTATGKVIQDSKQILDDNGALVNIGTDGTMQTEDKIGAVNSIAASLESGATVDGDSGNVSLTAGIPSGAGTRGDVELTSENTKVILPAVDKKFSVLDPSANDVHNISAVTAPFAAVWAIMADGNAIYPNAIVGVDSHTTGDIAAFTVFAAGGIVGFLQHAAGAALELFANSGKDLILKTPGDAPNGMFLNAGTKVVKMQADGFTTLTFDLVDTAGQLNRIFTPDVVSQDGHGLKFQTGDTATSGDSGPLEFVTGAAAGTRGSILFNALNVLLTAAGVLTVANIKLTVDVTDISNPPTDAELDAIFVSPAAVGAGFTAYIDDNGAGTNFYQITSDGTNWWIFTGTKAV